MINNVLVIGRNPNSILGMVRAAGAAGCRCGVIRTIKRIPGKLDYAYLEPQTRSRYVDRYEFAIEPDQDMVIKKILDCFRKEGEKVLLLPTDDFAAETIDLHLDELTPYFEYPAINGVSGRITRLMDKNYQKGLAINAQLPVARGWSIEISNHCYQLPEDIEYPCFVKPETAILNRKRYMGKCTSREELTGILDKAANQQDCLMLVETYIEIEKEYGCIGYCDSRYTIIPGIIEKSLVGKGSHAGVTEAGVVYPRTEYEDIIRKLESMVESTGFRGIFDIDLYESNGKIYFNEMNVRMGAAGYAIFLAGINLVKIFLEDINSGNKESQQMVKEKTLSCKQVSFINDKICLDDFGNGFITWKTYCSRIKSADHRFIKSEEDPKPYRFYCIDIIKQWMRRLRRKKKIKAETINGRIREE